MEFIRHCSWRALTWLLVVIWLCVVTYTYAIQKRPTTSIPTTRNITYARQLQSTKVTSATLSKSFSVPMATSLDGIEYARGSMAVDASGCYVVTATKRMRRVLHVKTDGSVERFGLRGKSNPSDDLRCDGIAVQDGNYVFQCDGRFVGDRKGFSLVNGTTDTWGPVVAVGQDFVGLNTLRRDPPRRRLLAFRLNPAILQERGPVAARDFVLPPKLVWNHVYAALPSSLAVSGNTSYISCDGRIDALDTGTGAIRWIVEQAECKLTTDGMRLYCSELFRLVCRSTTDGSLLWSYPGRVYSVAVGDGVIYVAGPDSLAALSTSGQKVWSTPLTYGPHLVAFTAGRLIVTSGTNIAVLDPATGEVVQKAVSGASPAFISLTADRLWLLAGDGRALECWSIGYN